MSRFLATLFLLLAACGGNSSSPAGDGGVSDAAGDAGCTGVCTDAPPFGGECDPQGAQCANCIDDDGDGATDGFDLHCAGPLDDDESSFSTGIPGDNIDEVKQDCFFDGNSGGGNDGCDIHVCCILGAPDRASCPIGANRYDPADCPPPLGTSPLTQQCVETCGPLTPPGCDCFGCCTVCDPDDPTTCYDIATNPSTSPNCTADTLGDPAQCLRCEKTTCGNGECGGDTCILCPGQTAADLPASCTGTACPSGTSSCDADQACAAQQFCSNGCCISVIQ